MAKEIPQQKAEALDHELSHESVETEGFVASYVRGDLSPAAEERFEAHFMDCPRCQEELELERSLARGMKKMAAEGAARSVGMGFLAWLSRRRAFAVLAILAVVAGGLLFARLERENERLEARVAELLDARATNALAEIPVILLGVVRSADERVPELEAGEPHTLAFDPGWNPRIESYDVRIHDDAGDVVLERSGLRPNALEVIQLALPTGALEPGTYRLEAVGRLPEADAGEASTVEIGSFPFRVAHAG